MKIIKHVKENKMRFYPGKEKVELTVNIDESSSEDLPIHHKIVRRMIIMNNPDKDFVLQYLDHSPCQKFDSEQES